MSAAAEPASAGVKVWPLPLRLFHWALVAAVATAWLTADDLRLVHEWAGYRRGADRVPAAAGPRRQSLWARLHQFVRGPGVSLDYLGDIVRGRERRYVGHNPAGGLMVLALIAMLAAIALTGWMQTTAPIGAPYRVSAGSRMSMRSWPMASWCWSPCMSAASSWPASAIGRIWCGPWSPAGSGRWRPLRRNLSLRAQARRR